VINWKNDSDTDAAKQAAQDVGAEPRIRTSTSYDFEAKNLRACGGQLPMATKLER